MSDVMALVDAVDLTASGTVLVAQPTDEVAARTAVTVLAGRHADHPVTLLTTWCAPVGVVAALTLALDATGDAGRGAALLERLLAETWSTVMLSDVSRLSRPNPTLLQHARSLLPGARFLVRTQPDPQVMKVDQVAAALIGVPPGTAEMVTTAGDDDDTLAAVVSTARPTGTRALDVGGTWSHVYGRAPVWQAALLPWGATAPAPPDGPPCDGCGLAAPEHTCRFCSRTLDPRKVVT